MRDELRFRPPRLVLTPELDWVLRRAFAAPAAAAESPPVTGPDLAAAVALARRLGLGPRLGATAARLPELAGSALAGELARESRFAAASALRAISAAREVARVAAEHGVRCCFLKGVALEALGLVTPGTRPLADLDALVAEAEAPRLAAALGEAGFVATGQAYPHQLAALVHPALGSVELHLHLPGVVAAGARRFATLAEVEAARLVAPWEGAPTGSLLPSRPLLAAHLVAHGLAQHGFRPDGYPLPRLLGDLVDLGAAGEDAAELLDGVLPLLSPLVPEVETRAAFAAARSLAAGDTALVEADSAAGRLLRHLLAAALDERYRESLKLQDLAHPLGEGGRLGRRVAAARHALFLSRAQVDAIYGPPRHPWGYAARRLLRPLDLAWRAGRALLS